jgi:hypothetical protein
VQHIGSETAPRALSQTSTIQLYGARTNFETPFSPFVSFTTPSAIVALSATQKIDYPQFSQKKK